MKQSQFILDFVEAFAESKGITLYQMISLKIGVDSLEYKYIDLDNKTINTIEELNKNVRTR